MNDADLIRQYYASKEQRHRHVIRVPITTTLTNCGMGLGDTLMLTDLVKATAGNCSVYSGSPHFNPVSEMCPGFRNTQNSAMLADSPMICHSFEVGNGHLLQRIRRAYGQAIEDKPKPHLHAEFAKQPNRVILHFEPGRHVNYQRKFITPRARMLYEENQEALEDWIESNSQYEFVEVGNAPYGIKGAEWIRTSTTKELIDVIATGSHFIGIMSGPMHIATAHGLKCVVVINFPDPNTIFLPVLKPLNALEEWWFYPQHVHLHQDAEGPQVKRFSFDNLSRAFDGGLYPYWDDKFLPMVHG